MREPVMIYVVPSDIHERPELAPLVEMGIQPGERIAVHADRDWDVTRTPVVTAAATMALRLLRPLSSPSAPAAARAPLARIGSGAVPAPQSRLPSVVDHRAEAARLLRARQ